MNLTSKTLGRKPVARCMVCHEPVRSKEPMMRFHGGICVHRRCATYRMRAARTGAQRLGYPPR